LKSKSLVSSRTSRGGPARTTKSGRRLREPHRDQSWPGPHSVRGPVIPTDAGIAAIPERPRFGKYWRRGATSPWCKDDAIDPNFVCLAEPIAEYSLIMMKYNKKGAVPRNFWKIFGDIRANAFCLALLNRDGSC
jgi:hypothetical protein